MATNKKAPEILKRISDLMVLNQTQLKVILILHIGDSVCFCAYYSKTNSLIFFLYNYYYYCGY